MLEEKRQGLSCDFFFFFFKDGLFPSPSPQCRSWWIVFCGSSWGSYSPCMIGCLETLKYSDSDTFLMGVIVLVSWARVPLDEKCMCPLSPPVYDVWKWTVPCLQRQSVKWEWQPSQKPQWVVFLFCVFFYVLLNGCFSLQMRDMHGALAQGQGQFNVMEWEALRQGRPDSCPLSSFLWLLGSLGIHLTLSLRSHSGKHRKRNKFSLSSPVLVSCIFSLSLLKTGVDFWLFLGFIISVFRIFSLSVSVIFQKDLANQGMQTTVTRAPEIDSISVVYTLSLYCVLGIVSFS